MSKTKILSILKTHFGYESFRPLQEEVVENIVANKDTFVLMPTGGGKSICYQVPALLFEGLTVVVSPLIALMKDQVDSLKANGIAAEFLNSSLTRSEASKIYKDVRANKVKILYVAPERLAIENFVEFLKSRVSLFAIDEAHCISEWGHDFRPDYRALKNLRAIFPGVPIVALTATATDKVRRDILEQLDIPRADTFISSFNRPNLHYSVETKDRVHERMIELLEQNNLDSTIIYCFSRKDTEQLAEYLNENGFEALPYHAGLDSETRKLTQERFVKDGVRVVTATIAFGMGIDKPNVRLVIHKDLPKSIEGYYQETGRAGRDGLPSECILFYSPGDAAKQEYFIRQIADETEKKNASIKLSEILSYCELESCRREYLLRYFGENLAQENCEGCDYCLSPKEEFDATIIAQKVISTVLRTGERFGGKHIIDVLRGKETPATLRHQHHNLSVFGIETEHTIPELRAFINKLIVYGLLRKTQSEFPVIQVTEKGRTFIKNREKLILQRYKPRQASSKNYEEYDKELFEQLRALRKKFAEEMNVPPFVVFGDTSLIEMARTYPQSLSSFEKISGVGTKKLRNYGTVFIQEIKNYCEAKGISEKRIIAKPKAQNSSKSPKRSTNISTKDLLKQKFSIDQIAQLRGVTRGTIISHIEKIKQEEPDFDIDYFKPNVNDLEIIREAFITTGSEFLKPVKELLGDKFSYDELRIARLFLENV
ncbi:MAG: DNA helicase RecQ [Candidatus Dojkabacteria bacterium]